jgi:hemolysin activation/secretion protein
VASLYGRYPLLRSRVANLHVLLGFDARRFRDRIDAATPSVVIDKRAAVGQLSLVGDIRDATWGGAITRGTLTLASGSLSADAGTPGSGHYDKLNLSLTRLQQVTRTISLQAALQGQLASSTLDVSEKLGLGGAAGVRAYPEGEAYVNEGYIANLEARVLVPGFSAHLPGSLQTFAFVDTGAGRVSGSTRTLSATGLGLTWFDGRTVVRAVYAHKLGAAAATSAPDSDGRVWVNLLRNF